MDPGQFADAEKAAQKESASSREENLSSAEEDLIGDSSEDDYTNWDWDDEKGILMASFNLWAFYIMIYSFSR